MKIEEILKLSYEEYIEILWKKYGTVKEFLKTKQKTNKELNGNYFLKENFVSKNQNIARGNEGLYIHHVDEDKGIMLSDKKFAPNYPFEFQKPERLVYCDLIEHLILHLKIVENPKPMGEEQVGIGGFVNFIGPELADYFAGYEPERQWMKVAKSRIIDRKDDFLKILKYVVDNKVFEKFYADYFDKNAARLTRNFGSKEEYVERLKKPCLSYSMNSIYGTFHLSSDSLIVKEIRELGWEIFVDFKTNFEPLINATKTQKTIEEQPLQVEEKLEKQPQKMIKKKDKTAKKVKEKR